MGEPVEGQLKKVMEQRAYTRIGKAKGKDGLIPDDKTEEVAEVVETQVKLAEELGASAIRVVATAAIRDAPNGTEVAAAIEDACRGADQRGHRAGRRPTLVSGSDKGIGSSD